MPKADYKNISLADIGLRAKMPSVLTKTKEQKQMEKVQQKKQKNQRVKKAMEDLKEQRVAVEQHRDFAAKELERQKAEKQDAKWARRAEHEQARKERTQKEKASEVELVKQQRVWSAKVTEERRQAQKRLAKLRKMIDAETEARAKEAPVPVHIDVQRTDEIERLRQKLPVTHEEQQIMEQVNDISNQCVLICGETGSGKTTQVPQFLWEAGYGHEEGTPLGREGMIAVTEPRRVAAISMARRVAEELNEPFGHRVCYHVRYDNNLHKDCKMKFMTEGILLKELQSDFLLRKYSVIVVDEAHERSVSCDVLLGLLSRLVLLRRDLSEESKYTEQDDPSRRITPLRLIVMSATLRVADFRDNRSLFERPPPLIEVPVRRFPVSQHFARKTELKRYVDAAVDKVKQIHKKLPPGGILIFLSTQREIEEMCSTLKEYYGRTRIEYDSNKFSKASKIASRRNRAAQEQAVKEQSESALAKKAGRKAKAPLLKKKGTAENEKEDGETAGETKAAVDDEFGLQVEDYALDGDEDFSGNTDNQPADQKGDDFDYGTTGGVGADSEDDEDAEARIQRALARFGQPNQRASKPNDDLDDFGSRRRPGAPSQSKKRVRTEKVTEKVIPDEEDWGEDDDDDDASEKGEEEVEDAKNPDDEPDGEYDTLHILPLYSLLDFSAQQRVFEPPPEGKRLCVIATNVAETSITIPNVRYVVDAGRVKTKTLQESTQAQTFQIQWISQAAAEQRAGRAGRTGPGHCYRLYSTAVYANVFEKHTDPEILRTPLDSVVLMMKHLRIDHVGRFPFPTSPGERLLKEALNHLAQLGAVRKSDLRCSALGSDLTELPVPPRLGKMILVAKALLLATTDRNLLVVDPSSSSWLTYGVAMEWICAATANIPSSRMLVILNAVLTCVAVCATTTDVFSRFTSGSSPKQLNDYEKALEAAKANEISKLSHPGSDMVTYTRVFSAFATEKGHAAKSALCHRLGLMLKPLTEAMQLRRQLAGMVLSDIERKQKRLDCEQSAEEAPLVAEFDSNEAVIQARREEGNDDDETVVVEGAPKIFDVSDDRKLKAKYDQRACTLLTQPEERLLRQIIATGLLDQVCRRASVFECRAAGYKYQDSKTSKVPYFNPRKRAILFVHPHSSIAKTHPPPEWLVYSVLERTERRAEMAGDPKKAKVPGKEETVEPPKTHMRGLTIVAKEWLSQLGYEEDDTVAEETDEEVEDEDAAEEMDVE